MENSLPRKIYSKSPLIMQDLVLTVYGLKRIFFRLNPIFKKHLNYVLKAQNYSLENLKEIQKVELRKIIYHAYYNVPYYHRLFREHSIYPNDIKTKDDLKKIPILTKADIRKYFNDLIARDIRNHPFVVAHTSGTTGTPLKVYIGKKNAYLTKAIEQMREIWAGFNSGDRIIRLVGDDIIPEGFENERLWRRSYSDNRIFLSSYHLNQESIPRYINLIKKFTPAYFQAYPSTAYQLAKYMESKNMIIEGIKRIFLSSEPVYDFQRRIIEKQFNSRIWGFYGSAEAVVTATQCSEGNYHLSMIDGILEITKDGENITEGEKGETVVTTLCNYSMPLIRYKQGDITGYMDDECVCGRELSLIYPVETKMEDVIVTPEGKIISPSILTFPFKDARNIMESQIVQGKKDRVIIKVVPTSDYKDEDGDQLVENVKRIIDGGMDIEIQLVSKIGKTSAGKTSFVINKIKTDFKEES